MPPATATKFLVADRIWVATALLHQESSLQTDFSKDEIRQKLETEGLTEGVEMGTINAHLDQNMVANVPPSSGKYRMLFEPTPGNLRLFRPGDRTDPARVQRRKPSKSIPRREELPRKYWPLLDWYETWCKNQRSSDAPVSWEDDPLIRLIGSGKDIWADEHADEYVENLRSEEPV